MFFKLSASSCHSNSLWPTYTQLNFSPQPLRKSQDRIISQKPPQQLVNAKGEGHQQGGPATGVAGEEGSLIQELRLFFCVCICCDLVLQFFFPLSMYLILMTVWETWLTCIERYEPRWMYNKGCCRWVLLPPWHPEKLLGCSTQSSPLTPFTLCSLLAKAPQIPQAANWEGGN